MDFHKKYTPKSLDDFFFHRETIENLRKFRDSLTHFRIYSDICNIGRKRILNLYLKEIGAVKEHIFYIDYQNIKTFENKDRLFQFLDSKSSHRKFIIIEHLQSISNKFMNDLINILKQNEAIVCFIDVDNSLNDTEILLDNKFSLGGRWLRGFDAYGAGPRNSRTSYVGGNNLLALKLDFSKPISLNEQNPIYFNLFNDYGTVWGLSLIHI